MKLLLLLALAGCDWSLHRMQEPVGCTVHGTTTLLPSGSCDLTPPDGIVAMDPPAAPPQLTRALMLRGRDRFERICAACHGVAGDGESAVARAMTLRKPPSLVAPAVARLADDRLLTVMTAGYGLMPAYRGILSVSDRYAVLHYIRALQQRDVALGELSSTERAEAARWLH